MPETAPVVTEHRPWCVRKHERGACSEKRGHWERSSNTWTSDLTDRDRRVMVWALNAWHKDKTKLAAIMDRVRQNSDTLQEVPDSAIRTWNMTQKRLAGMGKSWPIPNK